MMTPIEIERLQKNVRESTTQDLLDRVTVYRDGMEPVALRVIEGELRGRGVSWDDIEKHGSGAREVTLMDNQGIALKCSFCPAPAVAEGWGWHWMWGRIPVFPRWFRYCKGHEPAAKV